MKRAAISIAFLAILTTACSPSELIAEQILEGQEGIENVEIDESTGEIKIEIEGEDGEEGGSVAIGGGEVPDDFPIPLPAGGEVVAVFEQGEESSVQIYYDSSSFEDIKSFFEEWSQNAGDEVAGTFETSQPPSFSVTVLDGERSYNVSVSELPDQVIVTVIVGSS